MAAPSGEQDTERAIGTKLIAAGDARTAVIRRVYPASPETLWQAITDRTHLRRWFIEPRGDLRFGGTFALEGHAHGRILRCDPPRMLRVTWVYGPRHADELEVRLTKADGGGTVVELEHASIADTAPDGVTRRAPGRRGRLGARDGSSRAAPRRRPAAPDLRRQWERAQQDTERAIGTKLIAAGDARTAVLRRVYPASLETLWQAITDRTHLRRWFIEPRGDLRFGGTFALEGHAHGRSVLSRLQKTGG